MKCLVFFFISLGLAMSFPQPQYRDAEELENQMTGMSISLLLPAVFFGLLKLTLRLYLLFT
jgi:hypothetical protein